MSPAHHAAIFLALTVTTPSFGQVQGPAAGSFGFDWLRPASARCAEVSESILKRFRHCDKSTGAFGLSDPLFVCRVSERSEYMIFQSRDACVRNLETMKANAP